MNRDINEYFHEHCDKMLCKDCEMENDQKEEYVCYHQGFYVKGYQQGRADEREGIISKLANEIDEYQRYDYPTEDYEDGFERGCEFAFEKAIEIVRGEENE